MSGQGRRRLEPARGHPATDPRAELAQLVSIISEGAYDAGWHMGIECQLWALVIAPAADHPVRIGMGEVSAEQLARLRELAHLVEGWVRWVGEEEGEPDPARRGVRFVPMPEWLALVWKRRWQLHREAQS